MLEQNKFKQCLLSLDDNKILRYQLQMLIFVQVRRIIDKNYTMSYSCIGSKRTNIDQRIFKRS